MTDRGRPLDDQRRLAALNAIGLLDRSPDPSLERITRIAARIVGAPVALATLVDSSRQFIAGASGPAAAGLRVGGETPLSHSFCQHVVTGDRPLVVEDAQTHPLVADNPAISDYGVKAYLGVPLRSAEGEALGSLCAIDHRPHPWSDEDRAVLEDLAQLITDELRLRQAVAELQRLNDDVDARHHTDPATGLPDRAGWRVQGPEHLARARKNKLPVALLLLRLQADPAPVILATAAQDWRSRLAAGDLLARLEPRTFAALVTGVRDTDASRIGDRLRMAAPDVLVDTVATGWDGREHLDALLARASARLEPVEQCEVRPYKAVDQA